jgi:hypothetical protein
MNTSAMMLRLSGVAKDRVNTAIATKLKQNEPQHEAQRRQGKPGQQIGAKREHHL